jgi:hypothetical protein
MGTGAQLTILLLVLLWLALIGMVASLAIPLFEGAKVEVSESLPILVVLYLIARLQKARRKWLYPLVGLVGFLLMYAAGGYISNKASDELMGALSSLDPSLAIEIRSAGSNKTATLSIMNKAVRLAARRAPDAALIQFIDAKHSMLVPSSADYLSRCVAMARGSAGGSISYGATEKRATAHQLLLFLDAAAGHADPQPLDQERAESLLNAIYAKVYPPVIIDDPSKISALSEGELCRMFEAQTNAIRALPSSDAALVIRYKMLASPAS